MAIPGAVWQGDEAICLCLSPSPEGDNPTMASEHEGSAPLELRLHDDTIQMLFGLGLRIEYCIALMDESPEQAKEGLDHVITDLNEVIAALRGRIEDLK